MGRLDDTINTGMTFDNIYMEYYQRCFLFAKSYLHDEMLSKDIASEAMITLWTTMKTEDVKNIHALQKESSENLAAFIFCDPKMPSLTY